MERTTISTGLSPIRFDHFIEFPKDECLFGAGYEENSGRIRLFLIFKDAGRVYTLQHNSWQPVCPSEEDAIRVVSSSANREGARSYTSQQPVRWTLPQYFSIHHAPIQLN